MDNKITRNERPLTTEQLARLLSLNTVNCATDRQIESYYCGDLLSFVMGRAKENCCWFTIMSNLNVVAVAQLLDCACVVLCEGVTPDDALIAKAREHNINVYATQLPTCDCILALAKLIV